MWLPLKEYQKETLQRLAEYCAAARDRYDRGVNRFEREAFEHVTGRGYFAPPGFENVPYVCLRLPTGGGKTLLAAHALGTIGRQAAGDRPAGLSVDHAQHDDPRPDVAGLADGPPHPYREALQHSLGSSVEVVTLEEALTRPQSVRSRRRFW